MLILAAAVCGVRLVLSYNDYNKNLVDNLEVSVPTYDPSQEQVNTSFRNNILFICYDEDQPETQMMFVANVDSLSKSLNFLFLPGDMKFNIASGSIVGTFDSMYSVFSSSKGSSCASAVSSFFDVDVNYYFCIGKKDLAKLLGAFCSEDNGVLFDVPIDIAYRDYERNVNINFKKGTQYLSGEEMIEFLSFYKTSDGNYSKEMLDYYDGTDSKRLIFAARVIDAFLTQKFFEPSTDFYLRKFTELALPYISKSDTNLNENILNTIAQILSVTNGRKIGYYLPLGDVSFNGKVYLDYNGYIRNLELDENASPSLAVDVFAQRFVTAY